MRVNNTKDIYLSRFGRIIVGSTRNVGDTMKAGFRVSSFLMMTLFLALSFGCGPSSQGDGGRGPSTAGSNGIPEITDEIIHERINDAFIREVPEENGARDPIFWNFDHDEPKEITVVEKRVNGDEANIVLDIKTRSGPGVRNPRQLAGQIRTEWRLETGWVLRRWEIVGTENISMKYKDLPKPPAQNANH